ncbi:uncharacterized protein LOC131697716 isoform X4 [Acipenser ruthenus]|uniref:uncharacterized protein LOC131697716 isoform X4 n=1 Tax=Acipenser ruthenus TaxID=7906 RepID=UPI002740B304|nr:uncharacterized protein LOC131697716 isoform X4 [Acipenser ruthenus]
MCWYSFYFLLNRTPAIQVREGERVGRGLTPGSAAGAGLKRLVYRRKPQLLSQQKSGLYERSCPENEMFCFNNQQTSPGKPGSRLCERQATSWKAEGHHTGPGPPHPTDPSM